MLPYNLSSSQVKFSAEFILRKYFKKNGHKYIAAIIHGQMPLQKKGKRWFRSQPQLAEEVKVTDRTIRRYQTVAVEHDLIRVFDGGYDKANYYEINPIFLNVHYLKKLSKLFPHMSKILDLLLGNFQWAINALKSLTSQKMSAYINIRNITPLYIFKNNTHYGKESIDSKRTQVSDINSNDPITTTNANRLFEESAPNDNALAFAKKIYQASLKSGKVITDPAQFMAAVMQRYMERQPRNGLGHRRDVSKETKKGSSYRYSKEQGQANIKSSKKGEGSFLSIRNQIRREREQVEYLERQERLNSSSPISELMSQDNSGSTWVRMFMASTPSIARPFEEEKPKEFVPRFLTEPTIEPPKTVFDLLKSIYTEDELPSLPF